jgi:hypothetical protein
MSDVSPLYGDAAFARRTYLIIDFEALTPAGRSAVAVGGLRPHRHRRWPVAVVEL